MATPLPPRPLPLAAVPALPDREPPVPPDPHRRPGVPAPGTRPPLPPGRPVPGDLLRLLGAGRLVELETQLAEADLDPLVRELFAADGRLPRLEDDAFTLQDLSQRVAAEEPPGSPLRLWAQAIVAERLLADFDPATLVVARMGLDEAEGVEVPAVPPALLLYARARLLRVLAGAWVFLPPAEGYLGFRALRDAVINDFTRGGFHEQVALTRAVSAAVTAGFASYDLCENYELIVDARNSLPDDQGSFWPVLIDYFLAILAFEVGDVATALATYDRMEAAPVSHPRLALLPKYGRAYFRVCMFGATPENLADVDAVFEEAQKSEPMAVKMWQLQFAGTLADLGSPRAGRYFRLTADVPGLNELDAVDRALLECRVDILEGRRHSREELLALLDRQVGLHRQRRAARIALRLAIDLNRVGAVDDALALRAWGIDRLPEVARRTYWEHVWAMPLQSPASVPSAPGARPRLTSERASILSRTGPQTVRLQPGSNPGSTAGEAAGEAARSGPSAPGAGAASGDAASTVGPRVCIRVLTPQLEIEIDGVACQLGDTQARLLTALVVAHPSPVHVEQASELLWPDTAFEVTRSRLNTVVHRLRSSLRPAGDLVQRRSELVLLDGNAAEVDLWAYRRAVGQGPDERRRALCAVRGNLCEAAFPYEEHLVDERHRFTSDWILHARDALAAEEVTVVDLQPALAALRLDLDDVVGDGARHRR